MDFDGMVSTSQKSFPQVGSCKTEILQELSEEVEFTVHSAIFEIQLELLRVQNFEFTNYINNVSTNLRYES